MHFYNGSTLDNRRSVLQTGASVADIVCEDSLLEFVAGEIDSSQFDSEPDLMAWIDTGHSYYLGHSSSCTTLARRFLLGFVTEVKGKEVYLRCSARRAHPSFESVSEKPHSPKRSGILIKLAFLHPLLSYTALKFLNSLREV